MIKDIRNGIVLGTGGALVLVVAVWAWLVLSNTSRTEAAVQQSIEQPAVISPVPTYYNEAE